MASFKNYCESKGLFIEKDLDYYAMISDKALDKEYHYGRSKPGTFGYEANKGSAKFALEKLEKGETNIDVISDAIHQGWASVARTYDDPVYATKPEKKVNRLKLADTSYFDLPEEEKEKDRVVARALLDAFRKEHEKI